MSQSPTAKKAADDDDFTDSSAVRQGEVVRNRGVVSSGFYGIDERVGVEVDGTGEVPEALIRYALLAYLLAMTRFTAD